MAIIAGSLLQSTRGDGSGYFPGVSLAFALLGLGGGMSFMPLLTMAMADVPAPDAGPASGIVNVSMQISAAIGLAALGTISNGHIRDLAVQGQPLRAALTGGLDLALAAAAGCVVAALIATLVLLPTSSWAAPEVSRAA